MRHTSTLENSNRDIYPTARYIFPESTKYSFLELNTFDDFYNAIEPKLIEYIAENSLNIENLNVSNFMIDKMISNTRNHRRSKRNIVNKCARNCGYPENNRAHQHAVGAAQFTDQTGDFFQYARLFQSADYNKQTNKE